MFQVTSRIVLILYQSPSVIILNDEKKGQTCVATNYMD